MTKATLLITALTSLIVLSAPSTAAILTAANLAPNDLVITEYLADPVGVSDTAGEYFEIFNRTSSDIDLTSLIIRDDGSNSFTISALTLAAGSFAVFSNSDGSALGFTPDYVYGGSMSLTNTDDEIGVYLPDNTLISKVAYTDGDFFGDGLAHELDQLDSAIASVLYGPTAGSDFIAAANALQLGNFGSPGFAGGTRIASAVVPLPGAVWMFSSALSILCWIRRRTAARPGHVETSYADTPRKPSDDAHPSPISPAGHCFTDDRNWADYAGRALPRCI
jgi:hypothetical protein